MSLNASCPSASLSDINTLTLAIRALKALLLLPLCACVLYLGLRQWWLQRRFQSHSDFFTLHLAILELVWVLGFICFCSCNSSVSAVGFYASIVGFYGEVIFQALTCVERYLAVVHPITYRGLNSSRGIQIRGVAVAGVWLLSLSLSLINSRVKSKFEIIPLLCLLIVALATSSFCSFSVLWALVRPNPGGREKKQVDQTKRKAFRTITFIWSVLCLWLALLLFRILTTPFSNETTQRVTRATLDWLNLFSCLVLPLLYLRRKGMCSLCFNEKA